MYYTVNPHGVLDCTILYQNNGRLSIYKIIIKKNFTRLRITIFYSNMLFGHLKCFSEFFFTSQVIQYQKNHSEALSGLKYVFYILVLFLVLFCQNEVSIKSIKIQMTHYFTFSSTKREFWTGCELIKLSRQDRGMPVWQADGFEIEFQTVFIKGILQLSCKSTF